MLPRLLCFIGAATLVAGQAQQQPSHEGRPADPFDNGGSILDKNGDGLITSEEFLEHVAADMMEHGHTMAEQDKAKVMYEFEAADTNKDGVIDADEANAHAKVRKEHLARNGPPPGEQSVHLGQGPPPNEANPAPFFGTTGNKGYVTKEEFLSKAPQDNQEMLAALAQDFDEADADGDGKVTHEELQAFQRAKNGQGPPQGDSARHGQGPPQGHGPPTDEVDPFGPDGPGYVTKEQVLAKGPQDDQVEMAAAAKDFDAADTDGDEKLTREELEVFQSIIKERHANDPGRAEPQRP